MEKILWLFTVNILPFAALWMWYLWADGELGSAEYLVLLAIYTAHGMLQFSDGFFRGLRRAPEWNGK